MKFTTNNPQRLCMYPKDVQLITGKSERYGRKLLKQIRTHYRKEDHQFISIREFCEYTGLDEKMVEERLI